jgi:protein-glutamine gamma-glutamyltransferase
MSVDRALDWCMLSLCLTGEVALASTGVVTPLVGVVLPVVLLYAICNLMPKPFVLPRRWAALIAAVLTTVLFIPFGLGSEWTLDLLLDTRRVSGLPLIAAVVLLFARKQTYGYVLILLLTLILIAACPVLGSGMELAVPLFLFLFVGQCVLSLLYLRCEAERASPGATCATGQKTPEIELAFLRRRALGTFGLAVLSALLFAVWPRGGRAAMDDLGFPPLSRVTGMSGLSSLLLPGEHQAVLENRAPVMQVKVTVDGRPVGPDYSLLLRGAAMVHYDGTYWHLSPGSRTVNAGELATMHRDDSPDGLDEKGSSLRCEIWLEPLGAGTLFAPFPLQSLKGLEGQSVTMNPLDDSVSVASAKFERIHYTAVSGATGRCPSLHAAAAAGMANARAAYLDLPGNISQRVRDLACSIAASGADASPLAVARRIEAHLSDPSTYVYTRQPSTVYLDHSLDACRPVPGPGVAGASGPEDAEGTDYFLFETRSGSCTHFASAMAVLLRCVGIPARLATGFRGGEWNGIDQYFTVRQSDAHAWVEAYIVPYGWMTFDPSGQIPQERRPAGSWATVLMAAKNAWVRHVTSFDRSRQKDLLAALSRTVRRTAQSMAALARGDVLNEGPGSEARRAGVVLVLGGLTTAMGTAFVLWRKRLRDGECALAFYGKMLRVLRRRGIARRPSATPVEFARDAAAACPEIAGVVEQITERFCQVRYGGQRLSHREERDLMGIVAAMRRPRRKAGHTASVATNKNCTVRTGDC